MAGIRAGDLRRRITFEVRDTTIDDVGGQSVTWTVFASAWASVVPSVGRELMAAQAMQIEQPSTVTVRYRAILADPRTTSAMRIVFGGRYLNIHSVQDDEGLHRALVMVCSEGVTDG
jgi:SPP1 family predicted phage head-tail adaptor